MIHEEPARQQRNNNLESKPLLPGETLVARLAYSNFLIPTASRKLGEIFHELEGFIAKMKKDTYEEKLRK